MVQSCKYNPKRDLKKVSPIGALDLKTAFANNAIPANLQTSEGKFNGIDDPASIAGRPKDLIDSYVIEHQIKGYKAPENAE